jgi:3-oxoacyl-[acyl-carrier protein] reductase
MSLLQNKVAVVTGGARGIGEGVVKLFAQHGANVAFTYVSDSSANIANNLANSLTQNGITVKAYQVNAANYTASEQFVQQVLTDFSAIDICVNNAGISKDNLLLRMSEEQWDDVINTNLKSVFIMTKLMLKPMMKARSGSIINMSSVIGEMGNAGQCSYAASKAGMIGFTKSIAKEVGSRNIRCNAIAPGFVETDMTHYLQQGDAADKMKASIPLGKFATTTDVANAALYLASPLSTYVTGQVLSVCGGMNI